MPKASLKKKAANGYKLPEPFTEGEVLEDVAKKKWILGPSIGKGGFGEIYSAKEYGSKDSKYPYAIKIESHENGPLFVEMHFYIKHGKPEDVEAFKNQKGLKTFGMPVYHGSGSHELNGEKYRFLVMEKFGTDLWKTFLENDRHFPAATVFKLAVQLLDILEYIHSRGYVHSDIKGSNILMGVTKATQNKQVYLADFGLTCKSNEEEEFKPNPKKAHDGTIEYLSRDAHSGVQTKRGDLETLAYNLIQWLGCVLPWENDLENPEDVQKSKEEYMSSVPKFIKACFDKRSPSGPIVDFLNCLLSLEHNSTPDYKTIRKIFLSGITGGDALGKPFQFSVPDSKSPKTSPNKRKSENAPASSKNKIPKLDIEEDGSEDEKENLDDLSDQEEVPKKKKGRPKGKNVNTPQKQKKKAVGRKRAKKTEDEDLDLENNVANDDAHVSDIDDDEEMTKKEEKIAAPKENKKPRVGKRQKKKSTEKRILVSDRWINEKPRIQSVTELMEEMLRSSGQWRAVQRYVRRTLERKEQEEI
ncbi:unnamed protein product [Diabrotica balteata]|uniref:non-specific serine/threonine protein kinase n=1 Tax=Diabrotica balteata TaxID=107213 RepID=A0A9N9STS0_DIABA|nr:unnamed protein product [Diabrotica balteata]